MYSKCELDWLIYKITPIVEGGYCGCRLCAIYDTEGAVGLLRAARSPEADESLQISGTISGYRKHKKWLRRC